MRNRCDGDGQRDDIGEISELSQSTMSRSSASIARRAGREEGDEKEKSSNMMMQTLEEVGLEEGWGVVVRRVSLRPILCKESSIH